MKRYHWIMLILAIGLVIVSVRLAAVSSTSSDEAGHNNADAAIDCIMTRASVRSYTDRQVEDSTINKILRAGMAGQPPPTSSPGNSLS